MDAAPTTITRTTTGHSKGVQRIVRKVTRPKQKKTDKVRLVKAEKNPVKSTPAKGTDVVKNRPRSLSADERANMMITRLQQSRICS